MNLVIPTSIWLTLTLLAQARVGGTLITDLAPGGTSSQPRDLVRVGERLFFLADDGNDGFELHVSDGTASGTKRVIDLIPGPTSPNLSNFTPFLSKLFFFGPSTVGFFGPWISDGTAGGTFRLRDAAISGQPSITVYRDRIYFRAVDFDGGVIGAETVFVSDGTVGGTKPFGDFSLNSKLGAITTLHDRLLFGAADPTLGGVLLTSDGTLAGTSVLGDLAPGNDGQILSELVRADSLVYFVANDSQLGTQLWTTDGTLGGTQPRVGVLPSTPFFTGTLTMIPFGDRLLFTTYGATLDEELWITDGTISGTTKLFALQNGVKFLDIAFTVSKFGLVFSTLGPPTPSEPIGDFKLWRTDGTVAGTSEISFPGSLIYAAQPGVLGSDRILGLPITSPATGSELFRLDGSTNAPTLAFDLLPGTVGSDPGTPVRVGNRVFFAADDGVTGLELHSVSLTEFDTYVAEVVGFGCAPGSATRPRLGVSGVPAPGGSFVLEANALPANGIALLVASSGLSFAPLTPRCLLYPDAAAPGFLTAPVPTDAQGAIQLAVPVTPALSGVAAYAQVIAASGSAVPFASNGLELVFGN